MRDQSLFMQRGGGEGKKKGDQGYFRLATVGGWGWGRLNFFYKEVQGDQQFDREVYFKRGSLAKMGKAVKQQSTKNICETVVPYCTMLIPIAFCLFKAQLFCTTQSFVFDRNSALQTSLLFQILANKESIASCKIFGLTEFSFNKMLVTSIAQDKHD